VSTAVIFTSFYGALLSVAAAGAAWMHGWSRGVEHERLRGPRLRRYRMQLRHDEPLIGTHYSCFTASIDTPVTDTKFAAKLDDVARRIQAHKRPVVMSVVELDAE